MKDEQTGHKYECTEDNCKRRRFIGVDDARKETPRCLKCGAAMQQMRKEPVPRR
jgi:hypothetical protein